MAAMDVRDPAHPKKKFNTSTGRPNGAWGRGGTTLGPRGIYVMTADGPFDPAKNLFGETFMIFNPKTLDVVDYYTPKNWEYLNDKDLDLGASSPLVFNFKNWELVAGIAKEGVMYLLDGKSLGGADHQTPLFVSQHYANDEVLLYGRGVWGGMATWEDTDGQRWLYVPIWGPPTKPLPKFKNIYGMQESGSIMAFQLGVENEKPSLIPMWISESMSVPDPPVVANGVVFALSTGENPRQGGTGSTNRERAAFTGHASLRAFDAATGKQLYDSGSIVDDWTHYSGLAVSRGACTLRRRIRECTHSAYRTASGRSGNLALYTFDVTSDKMRFRYAAANSWNKGGIFEMQRSTRTIFLGYHRATPGGQGMATRLAINGYPNGLHNYAAPE